MKKTTLIITLALIIFVINIIAQVNPKKSSKTQSSNNSKVTTTSSNLTFKDTRDGKIYKIVKISNIAKHEFSKMKLSDIVDGKWTISIKINTWHFFSRKYAW